MKKNILFNVLLTAFALPILTSCDLFKKDTDYIVNSVPATTITFSVPDANAVKPTTAQQLIYTQPNLNVIGGTFSITGTTDITVRFSDAGVTNLTVNAFRTAKNATSGLTEIQREVRGTFTTFSNNSVKVVLPLNTLNFGGTAMKTGTANALVLEFVATANGKTVARYLTITGS